MHNVFAGTVVGKVMAVAEVVYGCIVGFGMGTALFVEGFVVS